MCISAVLEESSFPHTEVKCFECGSARFPSLGEGNGKESSHTVILESSGSSTSFVFEEGYGDSLPENRREAVSRNFLEGRCDFNDMVLRLLEIILSIVSRAIVGGNSTARLGANTFPSYLTNEAQAVGVRQNASRKRTLGECVSESHGPADTGQGASRIRSVAESSFQS